MANTVTGLPVEDDRLAEARRQYERAVFGGAEDAVELGERALDSVEADLALSRGRILHARFLEQRQDDPAELELFERAAQLYRQVSDVRGEAEALFWVGTYHQVVRGDGGAALPVHQRSYDLAAQIDDKLTMSYAVRHLGFADMAAGDMTAARAKLTESVQLRQHIGFEAGVAAGILALAELDLEIGDRDAAQKGLDEAEAVADACGAVGIRRWIDEARKRV
jgi:tetratricopeptide (TPR) repeat protein